MITATQFIDKKKIDKILVTQVAGHFAGSSYGVAFSR